MKKFALTTLALAAAAFAGESFGGIGVTIYAVKDGVLISDVIPGSPAASAGLESNDRIVAVDGVSLAGNDIEASKNVLRGTVGKPMELSVLREKESFTVTLRRANISVNDIDASKVEAWYGENQNRYSSEEIAEVASQDLSKNQKLLSVMQHGHVVKSEATVSSADLSMVSVETAEEVMPQVKNRKVRAAGNLDAFDREQVTIHLRAEGSTVVRIVNANGEVAARLLKEDAKAGAQTLAWDGKNAPAGRYIVHIEQNGAASAVTTELR
jgi:membrane-associated protease RseP (regulator of RpoE activity)